MKSTFFAFTFAFIVSLLVSRSYAVPTSQPLNTLVRRTPDDGSAFLSAWEGLGIIVASGAGDMPCSDINKDNTTIPSGAICSAGSLNGADAVLVTNVNDPLDNASLTLLDMALIIAGVAEQFNVKNYNSYGCGINGNYYIFAWMFKAGVTDGFYSIAEIVSFCQNNGTAV